MLHVALRAGQRRVQRETRFARAIRRAADRRGAAEHVIASVRMTSRPARLGRLVDVVLGVYLGDDVVDLLLSLGHHLARLLTDLVDTANGRPEQRI